MVLLLQYIFPQLGKVMHIEYDNQVFCNFSAKMYPDRLLNNIYLQLHR